MDTTLQLTYYNRTQTVLNSIPLALNMLYPFSCLAHSYLRMVSVGLRLLGRLRRNKSNEKWVLVIRRITKGQLAPTLSCEI